MAALAICAITAALLKGRSSTQAHPPARPGQPPPADTGMIPLTVPEVRRLLAANRSPAPLGLTIHWSGWTRRHQARARWFHQRTRLERDQKITMNPLRTNDGPTSMSAEFGAVAGDAR